MAWGSHPSLLPHQLLSKEAPWFWPTSLHIGPSFRNNSLLPLLGEPSAHPTSHSTLPTPLLLGEAASLCYCKLGGALACSWFWEGEVGFWTGLERALEWKFSPLPFLPIYSAVKEGAHQVELQDQRYTGADARS